MRRGGEFRGSARNRRARKLWLLSPEAGFGGDGSHVPCSCCGALLGYATLDADRHPVPGREGGRYVRGNIRPACTKCNRSDNRRREQPLTAPEQPAIVNPHEPPADQTQPAA